MCKISIIMPVYNKEKYVAKAIESVLNQTMEDWELLIIDDGSTDKSFEVCAQFKDERITLFHIQNSGVSRARNIGLDHAKGIFITFLDGDDFLGKTYLEKLYYPTEEMILGNLLKIDHAGNLIQNVAPELNGEISINEILPSFYQEQLRTGIYGFVASKAIKREIIERFHVRFDEKIRLAEDYDFFLRIYAKIENIYFVKDTEYFYVQATENSGIAIDDSQIDFWTQIEIQNKTKAFLEERNSFDQEVNNLYLKRVTGYLYTILLLNHDVPYNEFIRLFEKLKKYVPVTSREIRGIEKYYIWLYNKGFKLILYGVMKLRKMVRKNV